MKRKHYIKPEITVYQIATETILAGSGPDPQKLEIEFDDDDIINDATAM